MENASKALIIAGAILLSILIISLGIMVYNNAKSTVGDANLDSETIQTFNSKFTMYAGENITAAKVNSLIDAVNASNATNSDKINLDVSGVSSKTGTGTNVVVSNTGVYDVTYTTAASGVINAITIKDHVATP